MCGICGIVDLSGRGIDKESVIQIREALAHRGPDDAGLYVAEGIALGHRRLSIIDLSEAARQPLQNEDATVWAICNGEIYNYRDLRHRLVDAGHHFRSNSDTEVLVHAYEQWGMEGLLTRLKGMFAFAIWDGNTRTLLLARDRLGVKPLYYLERESGLVFASEIRALYGHVQVTPDAVNREALDYFLAFGYVPPDTSMVQGIHKLPPAHAIRYDRDGIKCWRYWEVEFRSGKPPPFDDQLEEVDHLLTKAVDRRLESDVPLGSFLSAGVDSGLVTALAARSLGESLRTFTVGFEGMPRDQDERQLARLVAQRYGTRHEEMMVGPLDHSELPTIMWHSGEPFADVSVLPTFQICRLARGEITVALTGDGGDESFCGYYNVYAAYLGSIIRRLVPYPVRHLLERPPSSRNGAVSRIPGARRLGTLMYYANRSPIQLYDLPNWWHTSIREELYDATWLKNHHGNQPADVVGRHLGQVQDLAQAEQLLYTDLHLRLPGDYLTKIDIASNIVALEIRSPFLDHELVEYAATLPLSSKMLRWRQKGLLRELARKYLPPESINRRKTGFGPPLGDWLRGEWSSMVRELVSEGLARRPDLFNQAVIRHTVDEHLDGRRDHTQRLWALLCLEVWWRMFVDRSMGPNDSL